MADNVIAYGNTGAGTDILAADNIGGVMHPRVKLVTGIDGVSDGDVSLVNPIPVGLRAALTNPVNATDGLKVAGMADKAGRAVTTLIQVRDLVGQQYTNIAATTETTIVTAGGTGVFCDIAKLIISTAGTAAATLTLRDSTAGTIRAVFNYPCGASAPGAPFVLDFLPPLPQSGANANWTLTSSVATAINVTAVFAKNS